MLLNCMHLLRYLLWHHNLHKHLCCYLLIQELLVDKTCFFEFLPISDKAIMNQLNIIDAICITSFSAPFHTCLWQTRKGKCLRLTNAIKHTEISYLIASLASRRFPCVSYQNVLKRGTSKLRNYNKLQKYEPFRFNSLAQNFHFGIFLYRVPFCLIFPGAFNNRN